MYLYDYTKNDGAGTLGQIQDTRVVDGLQHVTPQKASQIIGLLKNLFLVDRTAESSSPLRTHFNAVPREQAEAEGADTSQNAFESLKFGQDTVGAQIAVRPDTARANFVEVFMFSQGADRALLFPIVGCNEGGQCSPHALIDLDVAAPKTEKKEKNTTLVVLGAAAGGVAGFMLGGPVGAAAGGIGVALATNAITS